MPTAAASPDPRRTLADVRSLIVKLGSAVVTSPAGGLDNVQLAAVAQQVATLRKRGVRVTIVSSGAVAAGVAELGLAARPTTLPKLQAAAAVGQRCLMDAWAAALRPHGLRAAQVLLTREDADDRARFLNLRDTLDALDELGVVPIINENDSTATDELAGSGNSFGDNDMLAAVVCAALPAEGLIVLSTAAGLLDEANRVKNLVTDLPAARRLVFTGTAAKSMVGKGGMAGKLDAAAVMLAAGEWMIVADGREPNVLPRLLDGDLIGTLFWPPASDRRTGRRRWIATARPAGTLHVDEGAATALLTTTASLLPVGVQKVEGHFTRGDVLRVVANNHEIGRGLARYGTQEAHRTAGQIAHHLDPPPAYDEIIHRDDWVPAV